jgi:hypothetical protein
MWVLWGKQEVYTKFELENHVENTKHIQKNSTEIDLRGKS